jgi:hypothetical protein
MIILAVWFGYIWHDAWRWMWTVHTIRLMEAMASSKESREAANCMDGRQYWEPAGVQIRYPSLQDKRNEQDVNVIYGCLFS